MMTSVAEGGTRRLPPTEAHLWYEPVDEAYDETRLREWRGLLSPAELERHGRYHFEHGRLEYLVTRVLVRTVLGRYAGVSPASLRFESNAYGRPEIVHPRLDPPLRFNLSNTRGLVVCLVSGAREGGIDVEDTTGGTEALGIADHFFAPSEVASLRPLHPLDQKVRFFELWTLKEAYIKARGLGLALPLQQFAFELDGGGIRIRIDPRLADDERSWQFRLLSLTPRHRVAVAIRCESIVLKTMAANLAWKGSDDCSGSDDGTG
jgi:4'-phosphopantetheinyl transferase